MRDELLKVCSDIANYLILNSMYASDKNVESELRKRRMDNIDIPWMIPEVKRYYNKYIGGAQLCSIQM